jgi:hypothetical protein
VEKQSCLCVRHRRISITEYGHRLLSQGISAG